MTPTIYHLALRDDWRAAVELERPYRRSTLGQSLEDVGFIHCSFAGQVQTIADLVYRGRRDVVLLAIDPSLLKAEVRVESPDGGDDMFPHIYGELPLHAVVRVTPVPLRAGRLAVASVLQDD
jgi:glutathione S-transferase